MANQRIRIKLKSYDHNLVDLACSKIVDAAEKMGSKVSGPIPLPTEKEIFGKNEYGTKEPENVVQWEPMKLRRNRIAFQGMNGSWEWYWLANKVKGSAAGFAIVYGSGHAYYNYASVSYGVRPAFKIKNL